MGGSTGTARRRTERLPHYGGGRSEDFWRRVNQLDEPASGIVYALGCVLQDLETRVLRQLSNAEKVQFSAKVVK